MSTVFIIIGVASVIIFLLVFLLCKTQASYNTLDLERSWLVGDIKIT
jgi:hypothetical protein